MVAAFFFLHLTLRLNWNIFCTKIKPLERLLLSLNENNNNKKGHNGYKRCYMLLALLCPTLACSRALKGDATCVNINDHGQSCLPAL